jgi:hypothetical protein
MFILFVGKWILAPLTCLGGIYLCYLAYAVRNDPKPFSPQDLFIYRSLRCRSKLQLIIEGLFGVSLGIILFTVL